MSKKYVLVVGLLGIIFLSFMILKFFFNKETDQQLPENTETSTKVKIGYMPFTTNWPLFVAVEKDMFKEEGLDVELVQFNSGVDAANALAKGEIVSHVVNTFSDLFNLENRSPSLFKIYAIQQSSDENHGELLIARKDSGIESIEDLKGKKIGILPGSLTETLIKLAYKDDLDFDKDIELVKLAPNVHLSALESGQIEALLAIEPFGTIAVEKNIGFVLDEHPWGKVKEPFPVTAYTLSTKYLKENKKTADKIVKVMEEAIIYGRNNPEEAHKTAVFYVSVSEDLLAKLRYIEDVLGDEIDLDNMQGLADFYYDQGLIEKEINIKDIFYFLEEK